MLGFDVFGKVVKSVFGGVNSVVQTFTGSKKDRDKFGHTENIQTQKTYASEFHNRNNRTKFDSLIDGINRIPRPLFVVLIVCYFILSYINPTEFQVLNLGLSTVPENMWAMLSVIIVFYFGARELNKHRGSKEMAISIDEFNKVQTQIQELRQFKKDNEDLKSFEKESGDFINEIEKTGNSSVDEWLKSEK